MQVIVEPLLPPGRWFLIADPEAFAEWIRDLLAWDRAERAYGPGARSDGMGV